MTKSTHRRREPAPETKPDPLLEKPVPHAYALIPDPNNPVRYFAVHLRNVVAEGLDHLEPAGRPAAATYGMQRIHLAMERRHRRRGWRQPTGNNSSEPQYVSVDVEEQEQGK